MEDVSAVNTTACNETAPACGLLNATTR